MTKHRARELLKRSHPDATGGRFLTGLQRRLFNSALKAVRRARRHFRQCACGCGRTIRADHRWYHLCVPRRKLALTAVCLIAFVLTGCRAPVRPPPSVFTHAPRPERVAPEAVLLPPPARTNIVIEWDYDEPMPDPTGRALFEVWSRTVLKGPMERHDTTVAAPPVSLPVNHAEAARWYDVRTLDTWTGLTSEWSTR